jgi:hypothetical protein
MEIRKLPILMLFLGAALTTLSGQIAAQTSQTDAPFREEFHQTYPLSAGGRVSLENINGSVKVSAWDRSEVRVDAVKTARSQERLQEAQIIVEAGGDSVRIKTKYPSGNWDRDDWRQYDNPANVEYQLTVPRAARLDKIELINGALDIEGVTGDVRASSINGKVTARSLAGDVKLTSINGRLEATFDRLDPSKTVTLESINGEVLLVVPSDSIAQVRASTVHGEITNNFNLPVKRGRYVGSSLAGTLGAGGARGARIRLNNVNGRIRFEHAADNRPLSPATNLLPQTRDEEGAVRIDDLDARLQSEIARAAQVAVGEALKSAQMVTDEVTREINREVQNRVQEKIERRMRENAARISAEVSAGMDGAFNRSQRETKSFAVSGAPVVFVKTFDGTVSVRAWDKQEVMYEALKRGKSDEALRRVNLHAEQSGNEISIVAEYDKSRMPKFSSDASTQFEVFVPKNANVRVVSGDGRVIVEDVNGEKNLHTGDGRIEVRGGQGHLIANTGDGRISVVDYDGAVEAKTGDGRITLEGRFSKITARTGDGNIALALPADTNAELQIESRSEVVNEGFEAVTVAGSSSRPKTLRIGRGAGGGVFTLRTGDGQIILRRADSMNAKTAASQGSK